MRAQIALALDNPEQVLTHGGMDLGNVVKLGIYATDVDEARKNFDLLSARFGSGHTVPLMTLLSVTGLAIPNLMQ